MQPSGHLEHHDIQLSGISRKRLYDNNSDKTTLENNLMTTIPTKTFLQQQFWSSKRKSCNDLGALRQKFEKTQRTSLTFTAILENLNDFDHSGTS